MSQAAALMWIFGECREGKCPVGANARPLGTKEQARPAPAYGGVFAYRNLCRLLGGAGKCL